MNIFHNSIKSLLLITFLFLFSSCYSVRMITTKGVPEPNPINNEDGFYRQKEVVEIDTTISLKPLEKEFTLLEKCNGKGFHSIEYRNTFGGILLSAITFGKKRKVKVKYVCLKETN